MLTIKETSAFTGLSEYAIRIGIKNGEYPYFKVGAGRGKILIDLETFLSELIKITYTNMHDNKASKYSSESTNCSEISKIKKIPS